MQQLTELATQSTTVVQVRGETTRAARLAAVAAPARLSGIDCAGRCGYLPATQTTVSFQDSICLYALEHTRASPRPTRSDGRTEGPPNEPAHF